MESKDFKNEYPDVSQKPGPVQDWNQNLNAMNHKYLKYFDSIRHTRVNKWLLGAVIVLCLVTSFQAYYLLKNSRVEPRENGDLIEKNFLSPNFPLDNWEPFEEFQKMQRRMDKFFDKDFPGMDDPFPALKSFSFGGPSFQQFDLKDNGKHYIISLSLPGLDQSKVDVSVKDQTLKISGYMERVENNKDDNRSFQSHSKSHIERYMTLPGPVKPETINITYSENTMTIRIDKG